MWTSESVLPEMFVGLNDRWPQWLLGGQIGMLLAAWQSRDQTVWVMACTGLALVSLFAWRAAVLRAKMIADIPTSTIASAAQGYVELRGRVSPKPEYVLTAKSGLPCIWYRCVSYRKDARNNWYEVERLCSDSIFELNDASGESCIIDPEHAKVVTSNRRTWYSGGYKHVEEQLFPGQPLYVLGEFTTLSTDVGQAELNAQVSGLLAEWKRNRAQLLQRFDSNRDGKIDMNEWERVRTAAWEQINRQNRSTVRQPGIHLVGRPKDGRLFLLSNLPEDKLRRQSQLWAWIHLAIFFGGLIMALRMPPAIGQL